MPHAKDEANDDGIALVLVIWALALISALAAGLTLEVRAGLDGARTLKETSQARALAESGVWGAVAMLLDDRHAADIRMDGTAQSLPVAGDGVSVVIEDEAAKLDLNAAPEPALRTLFTVLGVPNAAALAQAAIGRRYTTIDELRLVPGITSAVATRLKPFVTVATGDWAINPLTARREVLAVLLDGDLRAADRYVAQRAQMSGDPVALRLASPPEIVQAAVWSPPRIVTVRATASLASGASYTRAGVFDLAPPDKRPYRVLGWMPVR